MERAEPMSDERKTIEEALAELAALRKRVAELERIAAAGRQAEEVLRESEERFRLLFNRVFDPVIVINEKGRIVDVNEAACRALGYTKEELRALSVDDIHPKDQMWVVRAGIRAVLSTGTSYVAETALIAKDGRNMDVEAGSTMITTGGAHYILTSFRDITDRKRTEKALQAISLVDELTGLYNRRGFMAVAEQQLKIAERARKEMILLFADLDNMKKINDTLGHQEGDLALAAAASVLRKSFREADIIGRIGGDEFVVLAVETGAAGSEPLLARLEANLARENDERNVPTALSFSVGMVHYDPEHPSSLQGLLDRADRLMYQNKRKKLNGKGF